MAVVLKSQTKSFLNKAYQNRLCNVSVSCLDEEIYGALLNEAKDSVENENSREGVMSRLVTVKEEMPPEEDYIPTVSLSVIIACYVFLLLA